MHLRKLFVLGALTVALVTHATRSAHADGYTDSVLVVGTFSLLVDAALTAHDLDPEHNDSDGYGVVETALTAPQVLGSAYLVYDAFSEDRGTGVQVAAIAALAWTGALLMHGVHTLVRDDVPKPRDRALALVPTAVRGGVGVGVIGRF